MHAGDLRVVQAAAASSRSAEENRSVKKVIRSGTGSGRRRAGMSYVLVPRSGRHRKPPRPRPGRPWRHRRTGSATVGTARADRRYRRRPRCWHPSVSDGRVRVRGLCAFQGSRRHRRRRRRHRTPIRWTHCLIVDYYFCFRKHRKYLFFTNLIFFFFFCTRRNCSPLYTAICLLIKTVRYRIALLFFRRSFRGFLFLWPITHRFAIVYLFFLFFYCKEIVLILAKRVIMSNDDLCILWLLRALFRRLRALAEVASRTLHRVLFGRSFPHVTSAAAAVASKHHDQKEAALPQTNEMWVPNIVIILKSCVSRIYGYKSS